MRLRHFSGRLTGLQRCQPGLGAIPYSGRATSLAINPANPLIMYLGTAGGGVWKTTDGGQTWAPITDTQASLAVGAITIDPNNVNTLYVGTGEADYSGDSYYGQGLLKSTDAGATWTQIATPFISGGSAQPFAQIAIQPGKQLGARGRYVVGYLSQYQCGAELDEHSAELRVRCHLRPRKLQYGLCGDERVFQFNRLWIGDRGDL